MRRILIAVQAAVLSIVAPVTHGDTLEDIQAWLNYDRPAEYEAIVTEVRPAMRDGVTLSCHLAVPGKNGQPVPGKFPGIISNVNPYTLLERFFINGIKRWAEYGYQGLTCRVRGTGDSQGEYTYYSADTLHLEWTDSYDLVEWFAAQPGSNGRIGQEGASYGGLTAYQAASVMHPTSWRLRRRSPPAISISITFTRVASRRGASPWTIGRWSRA